MSAAARLRPTTLRQGIRRRWAPALLSVLALVVAPLAGPVAMAAPSELTPPVQSAPSPRATPGSASGGAGSGSATVDRSGVLDLTSGLPIDRPVPADGSAGATGTTAAPAGVETTVRDTVARNGRAHVIVRLADQVDADTAAAAAEAAATAAVAALPAGSSSATQANAADAARAAAVVEALQSTADTGHEAMAPTLADLEAAGHVSDVRAFWIFSGYAATVDADGLAAFAADPNVGSITLDEERQLPPLPGGDPQLPTWSLETINAPDVWGEYGDRGDGVVVGTMDSGADASHPALAASWRGRDGDVSRSWFAATGEAYPTPDDGNGHGTHVMGSILGAPPGEVTGVAPEATWIAAKIFRDSGSTTDSIIHAGFEWMLAPGGNPANAPDVVNNSWGSDATYDTEFLADVQAWRAAGIVPIFAAGNAGPGTSTVGSPASFLESISVGNTDRNDLINLSSSRGPVEWDGVEYVKPELSAPGTAIRSAWPEQLGGGYRDLTGTSMASPHVTGTVALLLSADPTLSVDDVEAALVGSARAEPHMGELPSNAYGAGIVDAYGAVTLVAHSGEVSGVVSSDGSPVAGATVSATSDGADPVQAETAADGSYSLDLRAGTWTITVMAYGYVGASRDVDVVVGGAVEASFDLAVAAEHLVTGTVSDGDGAPIAGTLVVIDGTPLDPVRTEADGGFALTVAEGTYDLRATAAGFEPTTVELVVDGAESITVVLDRLATPTDPGWATAQNSPARLGQSPESLAAPTLQDLWQADIAATTFSSPVIGGGAVYIGSDDGDLTALDLETGAVRWVHEGSAPRRGTPTYTDGVVIAGAGIDGGVVAVDADTGAELWRVSTPGQLAVYGAPAVVDGVAYVVTGPTDGPSDSVIAIDVASGGELWRTDVGELVYAGPAAAEGAVVVGNGSTGELIALDAATGSRLWTLDRTGDAFVAAPSIVDGTVYIATTGEDGSAGSVLAVDLADGDLIWERDDNGDGQGGTPTVYGGVVITTSHIGGTVSAYDRATGDLVWRHGIAGAVSAPVLVSADGYVVGGSQLDNRFWALDAATGDEVWSLDATRNVTSAPALADGRLILTDGNGVIRALAATGTIAGTITGPSGPVSATVRVAETGESTQTDPDTGAYTLITRPGAVTLQIRAYGLSQADVAVEVLAGQTITVDRTLDAVGDGSVVGRVVDEGGAPVEGVSITVAGTPLDPATTGADGTFTFPAVAAGTYEAELALAGWQTTTVDVTIDAGAETDVGEITLLRYQIALTGDYLGRMLAELEALGYRVEPTTYAAVTANPGAYQAVVANGAQDDPGEEAFRAFLDATDAAGTSVVFLDQWSLGWGATNLLTRYLGDPADLPDEYGDSGRIMIRSVDEHPLTAGLPLDEPVELIQRGNEWSAYAGWSGVTVATLATDTQGEVGGTLGYQPRGMGSAHVLVGSLAAAASWGIPDQYWAPAADTVLANAVAYALDAAYGDVSGTVTDGDGNPLDGVTITVADGYDTTTTDADGHYSILLEPGERTLRFSAAGSTPVEQVVSVEAGTTIVVDVTLETSGLGAVSGRVTSGRDGSPLAGATVELVELGQTTTTASDGTYGFDAVAGGTYELRVSADGHFTSSQQIEVVSGQTTTANVVLEASPVVGVLGDYATDGVVLFLQAHEIEVEAINWTDVTRVGDFDVIVFNDPTDPGEQPFKDFLAAMDAAEVSGVFGDDWLGAAIDGLLVDHLGDPEATDWESVDGTASYHPLIDSPLFDGIEGDALLFSDSSTYATWFTGYSGIPLAESVGEIEGTLGIGAAYMPRTPHSIHLLLGGFALTSIGHSPNDGWVGDAEQVYLNAIRWAAAPGLGSVAGSVTSTGGDPLTATVEVVETGATVATDPADGSYEVALPAGDYTLRFTAFGYTAEEHAVTVQPNQATGLDVQLVTAPVGAVSGVITSTGGVIPPGGRLTDGEPVAGATVSLLGTPRSTTTDEDGAYTIPTVEPGTYELEVVADGHVRTRVPIEVVSGETADGDVGVRVSPRVGVIDEDASYPHALGYLTWWGYDPIEITWADTALISDLDLVVANLASFPNQDPGADGFAAFSDAANRAGVSVIWLDQFGRGSFQWLVEYDGDPVSHGSDRSNDDVIVTATEPDHPLLAGLPASFPLVATDAEYSWFGDWSGTTVATVTSTLDPVAGGNLAGVRARGAGAVDVLLGTLSISTYGWPAYGENPGDSWTPEAERLLRNALSYALDTDGLGAEARGRVMDAGGDAVPSTVTVVETGDTAPARPGDGAFVLPLDPGTWTLRADAFGWQPSEVQVTVEAGDVATPVIVLEPDPVGTISGRVTGASGAISGATVTLVGTGVSTLTDGDGRYTIPSVPEGSWTVKFDAAGYMDASRDLDVVAGQTTVVDVTLETSRPVAVVEDATQDSIEHLLEDVGYTVEAFEDTQLTALLPRVSEFRLIIVNNAIATAQHANFTAVLDAAAAAGVSVIVAGQWGGGAIDDLREIRGDPAATDWDFVEDTTIEYTPLAEHPIFAGFPIGEPVTLMGNATENQQWLVYSGYSGTPLADITSNDPENGPVIGSGVGVRFTSATSVEILLASLSAGTYGRPDEPEGQAGRWTPDAVQIYLNAVDFATAAEQGAVTGTVTGDGGPVGGATVTAVELGSSTTTAADGTYELGLPDGTHTIRVEATGFDPTEQPVEIAEAGTVVLDVDLMPIPRGHVVGTITDKTGPVVGATVTATGPESWSVTTGADGTYDSGEVLPGQYTLTIASPRHVPVELLVTVERGATAHLDATLVVIDVGVLGDWDGDLTELLLDRGFAATELEWSADLDLDGYRAIVVNGGDPDAATFAAVIDEVEAEQVGIIYTGTWGVDQGGVRLLERYTDRVTVAEQGYGRGFVKIVGYDADHRLFKGIKDPARIINKGGYYSLLGSYDGKAGADLRIGGDVVQGLGIGWSKPAKGVREIVLASSAVTGTVGPDLGWKKKHVKLLRNAVKWAR